MMMCAAWLVGWLDGRTHPEELLAHVHCDPNPQHDHNAGLAACRGAAHGSLILVLRLSSSWSRARRCRRS